MSLPPVRPAAHDKRPHLVVGVLVLAVIAAIFPMFWFASVLAVTLTTVLLGGRGKPRSNRQAAGAEAAFAEPPASDRAARGLTTSRLRWTVAIVGGALAVVSCIRFAREIAGPNLHRDDAEEEKTAMSRLREIYWAESQARKFKLVDENHDDAGEYLSLPELIGEQTARLRDRAPLLKPGMFVAVDKARGVYASERYLYVVYLPGADGSPTTKAADADPAAASRSFAAYAWPLDVDHGKHRAFYTDQYEQICENPNNEGFYGPERPPTVSAYALNATEGVSRCGQVDEGGEWRPWTPRKGGRVKAPRATR